MKTYTRREAMIRMLEEPGREMACKDSIVYYSDGMSCFITEDTCVADMGSDWWSAEWHDYTEPKIEWVTPTDEDARHRPEVEAIGCGANGYRRARLYIGEPMRFYVYFLDIDRFEWVTECHMDAKLREAWK
jgi:hypothetical protein